MERPKREQESLQEQDSEATSEKTLDDIKESEKVSSSEGSDSDNAPSPDGAFDESDETKDAGPM